MTEETDPAAPDAGTSSRLRLDAPYMKTFFALLANTLVVSVINFTVWFAITFYVFLETRSVFATGMIAGLFLVAVPEPESAPASDGRNKVDGWHAGPRSSHPGGACVDQLRRSTISSAERSWRFWTPMAYR
jgi:hypothetical protein